MPIINFDREHLEPLERLIQLLEFFEYAHHFNRSDLYSLNNISIDDIKDHSQTDKQKGRFRTYLHMLQLMFLGFIETQKLTHNQCNILEQISRQIGEPKHDFAREGEFLIRTRINNRCAYPLFYQLQANDNQLRYQLN